MTDIVAEVVKTPKPNDPSKFNYEVITHAVAVVGYTETNEIIFFDPAEGNFQTANEDKLNATYVIVIKSTKNTN